MALADTIHDVLNEIPIGHVFDSHFVIEEIRRRNSDEYIRFTSDFAGSLLPTLTSHQQIGHQIAAFEGTLVERLPDQSYSINIHDNASECALWKKL